MSSVWSVFALLLFCTALGFDLQIFHTNDLHSRFDEISDTTGVCRENHPCFGGFARVAHFVKTHRKNNTLVLNAGDSFQGTPLFVAFGTEILQPMIDSLDIDAMSLGNHEFDRGPRVLRDYLDRVMTPVVTCNVDGSNEQDFANAKLNKSIVIPVGDVKVGVVGYLLPATKEIATVGNVILTDEVECIRKEAQKLKKEGVHVVIAVGHSGWTKDLEIAEKVEEVDVVVGGHTDTFLYTGTPPSREKPEGPYPTLVKQSSGKLVPAVQAYGYTKYVGVLNLSFDDKTNKLINATGNPVLMTANLAKCENVTHLLEEFKKNMSAIYKELVCITEVDLNGSCKKSECNLGDIIADAAAEFVDNRTTDKNREFETIGWINGGNIRSSVDKSTLENGRLLLWDLATILPFPAQLVQVRVVGSMLLEQLNHSYDQLSRGGFLQVSKMKIIYPQNKTKKIQAFVKSRKGQFEEVMSNNFYDVVVTDYLFRGGDGYNFSQGEYTQFFDKPQLDIVREWMARQSPITVKETDRIVFDNGNSNSSGAALPG
ncbi:protein 5NUC-like [Cimex lectularius]|uniref:5'-nucleotidase n=1 Tax=Cimex lectularius TaxID=79782 RepID=A0A8I6TC18_CIMLE|nr:protein 5NUC-like [Cimex lectularius]